MLNKAAQLTGINGLLHQPVTTGSGLLQFIRIGGAADKHAGDIGAKMISQLANDSNALGETRTPTQLLAHGPEPCLSTNSSTRAKYRHTRS